MRIIVNGFKMFVLGVWSLSCILIAMVAYLFTWTHKSLHFLAVHLWSPLVIWWFGARISTKGIENVKEGHYYVVMANHSSFLDIPVLLTRLPIPLYFVAKKELKRVPFLGWFISMAGMIFIDRSNRAKSTESINKAAELINKGRHVVIFPEGTASRTGEIGEFKKGGFHLALNSKATILPIRIIGTGSVWPRGGAFRLKPGKVEVIVGQPIVYEDYKNKTVGELAIEVREQILNLNQ